MTKHMWKHVGRIVVAAIKDTATMIRLIVLLVVLATIWIVINRF